MSASRKFKPFSVRLSDAERACLEREAGRQPLGTYIRSRLLGGAQEARNKAAPKPKVDYELLGRVLAALGKSELASSLCLLAVAAESGSLLVDEEVSGNLKAACEDVRAMRTALVGALGLQTERSV